MTKPEREPLDVWLRIPTENNPEDEAEAEANVYHDEERGYYVEWYLNAVGQVTTEAYFATHEEARRWLTNEGFDDYTT